MSERPAAIEAALAAAGFAAWTRAPLTGDASARRYERLRHGAGTLILMDAPDEPTARLEQFAVIAAALREAGLAAPEVLYLDRSLGLMVLEDLGADQIATWLLRNPEDERDAYETAIDILPKLATAVPPPGLHRLDGATGAAAIAPVFDWSAPGTPAALRETIQGRLAEALAPHDRAPAVLALRDYHAENLIWRPNRVGTDRVGLLDFQDAVLAHPGYDLASLIRDARRDLAPGLAGRLSARLARAIGADATELAAAATLWSLQRNLRILGIFHRLARQDGKTRYLAFVPRLRAHIAEAARHPAARKLQPLLARLLGPVPAQPS